MPQMSGMETEIIITVEGTELTLLRVKKYDLVLYNFLLADPATYYCKAIQGDVMLTLAIWTIQIRQGN